MSNLPPITHRIFIAQWDSVRPWERSILSYAELFACAHATGARGLGDVMNGKQPRIPHGDNAPCFPGAFVLPMQDSFYALEPWEQQQEIARLLDMNTPIEGFPTYPAR